MKKIGLFTGFFVLLTTSAIHSQDNFDTKKENVSYDFSLEQTAMPEEGGGFNKSDYLSTNNYLGFEILNPKLKKDWVNESPWVGINAQLSYLRFGFSMGNASKTVNGRTLHQKGHLINIGAFYNHPIHVFKNYLAIEPEVGLDFYYGQFRDDPTSNPIGLGFGFTPGLGIKMGPIKMVGKYTMSFAANLFDKTNAWTGGFGYLSFGAYIETGWGLMNPKLIQSKGYLLGSSQYRDYLGSHYDYVNDDWYNVYKVTTVYYKHSVKGAIHDIGPFWYLSPKYNSSFVISRDNRTTSQMGGAVGFRSGIFGGEAFVQTGKHGFGNQLRDGDLIDYFNETKDHSGYVNSTSVGGQLGFEVMGLLTKIFVHEHEDRSIYNATRFMRILVTGGYGVTFFDGDPVYYSQTAQAEMNALLTDHPELTPGSSRTPGSVSSSPHVSIGVKLEMGLVSIGFEKYTYKRGEFGNGSTLTMSYLIPPGRIQRALKVRKMAKVITTPKQ